MSKKNLQIEVPVLATLAQLNALGLGAADIGATAWCTNWLGGARVVVWDGTRFTPYLAFLRRALAATLAPVNTTATYVTPNNFTIPANTLAVGDSFRVTIQGTHTATAAGAVTFTPRFGAAGTTADTGLTAFAVTSAATGTNVPYELVLTCVVRAIGSSGSIFCYGRLTNNGTTGISSVASVINVGGAVTVNTTVDSILGVSLITAAASTTSTIQSAVIEFIR